MAQAASGEVKLGIRPVGQPGDYFDLTLRPGEGRDLQVDLGNLGDSTIQVRSYASDVYTIIDGGFGARLRDEPRTGMTMWLDYTTVLTDLAVGGSVRRGFSVRVPDDAAPGEYATSIIVENETPRPGNGTVRLDQINRQAVAVLVTVPGPRTPGLAIGAATHKMFNGTSMVSIAVRNTGNVRLRPVVGFTLFDSSGVEVRHGEPAAKRVVAEVLAELERGRVGGVARPGPVVAREQLGGGRGRDHDGPPASGRNAATVSTSASTDAIGVSGRMP